MEEICESSPLLGSHDEASQSVPGSSSSIHPNVPSSYQNPPEEPEEVVDGKEPRFTESPLNDEQFTTPVRVYFSRFWILALFSLIAMFQCVQWNTWGPLSDSVNAAYSGWGSATVAMMANWGTITFVIFITPMCWILNAKGLREGVFCCAILIAAGTVLRVLSFVTSSTEVFTISCHLCAILVGTAGTLVMAAPPTIAAEWFPPNERTTATGICQVFNQLGNAGSYLEPLLVRSPANATPEEIRKDIKLLMYIDAGIGVALLLAIFLYYPSKPPSPPSVSSSVERLQFWESIKKITRNPDVMLVTLAYGVSLGVPSAWIAVLNYSLKDININQDDAMWIGLAVVLVSSACALISSRLTDMMYGYIRITLIVMMCCTVACFYWFYLITYGSIPVVRWQVYTSIVLGMGINFATCPLFFELAVENAHPCPEIVVGGLATFLNNALGVTFLFIFFIKDIGYSWVIYLLLATSSLSIIPLLFVKEDYSRSHLDRSLSAKSPYQPI